MSRYCNNCVLCFVITECYIILMLGKKMTKKTGDIGNVVSDSEVQGKLPKPETVIFTKSSVDQILSEISRLTNNFLPNANNFMGLDNLK